MAAQRKTNTSGIKAQSGLKDVAARAGIGIATASSVLNNSRTNTRVSQATRERVLAAAKELRYHPNALARALTGQPTKTLGVLFGLERATVAVANPYAFTVLQGIIGAAAESGYNVMFYTEPWHNAAVSAGLLRDRRTDGVLLISVPTDADVVPSLVELGLPVVGVSSSCDRYGVPSVDVDNAAGARIATEHLLQLGHRRIAHLKGDDALESANHRHDAFCGTLATVGLIEDEAYALHGSFEAESGFSRTIELLALPYPPTAIFAANDTLAQAAIDAARQRGISVPNQLSIVGFDDIPLASHLTPPLTTVRQPLLEIGAEASRLLINLLQGKDVPAQTCLFQPELVVRGSTAPPVD
jgi:LacI family transcriptional regulator